MDYQTIIQDEFKNIIFGNNNLNGVKITLINKNYYISNYIKEGDILVSINNINIDNNGHVKFNFYPEKILINDIGLWFKEGDEIIFGILDLKTKKIIQKSY
jgi:hypothetical protein